VQHRRKSAADVNYSAQEYCCSPSQRQHGSDTLQAGLTAAQLPAPALNTRSWGSATAATLVDNRRKLTILQACSTASHRLSAVHAHMMAGL
jgi:hypothetical protein